METVKERDRELQIYILATDLRPFAGSLLCTAMAVRNGKPLAFRQLLDKEHVKRGRKAYHGSPRKHHAMR